MSLAAHHLKVIFCVLLRACLPVYRARLILSGGWGQGNCHLGHILLRVSRNRCAQSRLYSLKFIGS